MTPEPVQNQAAMLDLLLISHFAPILLGGAVFIALILSLAFAKRELQ